MISPNTAPGTLVVCVNDGPIVNELGYTNSAPQLRKYKIYTVERMIALVGDVGVSVREAATPAPHPCFSRARFKPAVLPSCLTELLVRSPQNMEA